MKRCCDHKLATVGVGAAALMAGMMQAATVQAQGIPDGPYVGVHMGVGGPNTSGVFDRAGTGVDMAGVSRNGVLGGGQVGWNFNHGIFLFGIEGDISAIDWGRSTLRDEEGDVQRLDTDLFATIRGRLGLTQGNSMSYGTIGVAFFDGDLKVENGVATRNVSAIGLALGSGIETMVSHSLSFKVEGLWVIFDDRSDLSGLPDGDAGDNFKLKDAYLARIGLNWHFGGPGGINVAPAADRDPVADNRWSGPYAGIQYGDGGVNTTGLWDTAGARYDIAGISRNGVFGGAHVGWNIQSGDYVFGIEGDVNLTDWDGRVGPDSEGDVHKMDVDLFATARVRAGKVFGDALVYATGGVGILDTDITMDIGGAGPGRKNITAVGGVVGAGIETFIFDNVTARAEGLYVIFDKRRDISDLPDGDTGDFLKIGDGFVFRSSFSYHFPIM